MLERTTEHLMTSTVLYPTGSQYWISACCALISDRLVYVYLMMTKKTFPT